MDYGKIYDYVLNEKTNKNLDLIEKNLKGKISNGNNEIIKQEFFLMLLITLLKKNKIETNEMKKYFNDFNNITLKVEKYLITLLKKNPDFSSKMLLDVFYTTNIYNLLILERLYKENGLMSKSDKVKVMRKDLERNNYFFKKDVKKLLGSWTEKLLTNYGTSFWYLFSFTFLATIIFGFLFMVSDMVEPTPYVCGEDCIHICENSEDNCQAKTLKNFLYYFYVSMATMSNLGGDIGFAGTNWLIFLFTFEQVIGVVLFGLLINLLGKKL